MTRRRISSGFTLVELMVAVAGGLFVTIAVFTLAKQATGLYQSEARVSNATLGSVVGFERLRTDLARAGFLASPNVRRDPKLCGAPDGSWPAQIRNMSAVTIQRMTTVPPALADNGIAPDQIVLAGSYATTDQFAVAAVSDPAATITLQTATAAMARLGYAALTPGQQTALLSSVFGVGRALRITDGTGKVQFGTIASVQGGARPQVNLVANSPTVLRRESSATFKCGIAGEGAGSMVNPVNFVKYSLRSMAGSAAYSAIYDGGPATDAGRTELVREELDAAGNSIPSTEEIVSELAVDLAFGITVAEVIPGAAGAQVAQLRHIPAGDPTLSQWAGDTATMDMTLRGPQLVRVVRARLGVRSREADRASGVSGALTDGGGLPVAAGLYRIGVGPGGGGPFARVRTVQADVTLRNLRDATWL